MFDHLSRGSQIEKMISLIEQKARLLELALDVFRPDSFDWAYYSCDVVPCGKNRGVVIIGTLYSIRLCLDHAASDYGLQFADFSGRNECWACGGTDGVLHLASREFAYRVCFECLCDLGEDGELRDQFRVIQALEERGD